MKTLWLCVAESNRFAQAQVLEEDVKKFCPEVDFQIYDSQVFPKENVYHRVELARWYRIHEALTEGYDCVVSTGADYQIFSSEIGMLWNIVFKQDVAFTPHVISLNAFLEANTGNLMRGGYYNSDFQVWYNTNESKQFLKRVYDCVFSRPSRDFGNIFEYGQTWIQLASKLLWCKDLAFGSHGISYYNLHERSVLYDSIPGNYYVNGSSFRTLLSWHHSGLEFHEGSTGVSKHADVTLRALTDAEREIVETYRSRVQLKMKLMAPEKK